MISLIDCIFLIFALAMILLHGAEKYSSSFIRQCFRYGKFSISDPSNKILKSFELRKCRFKDFYILSAIISTAAFVLAVRVYFFTFSIPPLVISLLDLFCGSPRPTKTRPVAILVSLFLMSVQCWRRFYETHFVQVFSDNGRINLSHYLAGHFHYFGCITVILGDAAGFSGREDISKLAIFDWQSTLTILPVVVIFSIGWINQYRNNLILANLRKDKKSNSVVSQKHFLPEGGWFRYVSNPHLLCEILMYLALTLLLHKSFSWLCIVTWVLSNQIVTALLSHRWYKETFPKYPKERKALVPYIF